MNRAWGALWNGDAVGEQYREYLLEILGNVKPGLNYLTAAVPEGDVSHKSGWHPERRLARGGRRAKQGRESTDGRPMLM